MMIYDMIHLLPAIGLPAGGSSTVHIYTQTIQRTTKWTSVGRLSGIRTQSGQIKINDELKLTILMKLPLEKRPCVSFPRPRGTRRPTPRHAASEGPLLRNKSYAKFQSQNKEFMCVSLLNNNLREVSP
jgi:hypothetical protein